MIDTILLCLAIAGSVLTAVLRGKKDTNNRNPLL